MIAKSEEQRSGASDPPEVVPLGEILPGGILAAVVLLGHEGITEVDVEVRRIRERFASVR